MEVIGQSQRENEALVPHPEDVHYPVIKGSDQSDQLYLHSNVPALVAIFIRFRRRGRRRSRWASPPRSTKSDEYRHESGYVGVEMPSGVINDHHDHRDRL